MIKTFPTLYKRTKTGAIQYWTIQVAEGDFPIIDKWSGQLGTTSPIHHSEQITEGKNIGKSNETTPNQQALSQAESDWKKKRDEGYKSLEDLGIHPVDMIQADNKQQLGYHHPGYNKPNTALKLSDALDQCLPQFNSDANGNVKPMLATDWTKVKDITYPCYIQPKLDGVRCLMIVQFSNEGALITFLSRSGKPYTTLSHLIPAVEEYCESSGKSFILDGEIYSDELTFQEITAAVKKQRPESLKLHFRAYDIVNDEKQSDRYHTMFDLVFKIKSPFITSIVTEKCFDADEAKRIHDEYVNNGYEGAMLRLYDGLYGQGQRSRHLLKVKEFDETEFEFSHFEKGQRDEDLIAICRTTAGERGPSREFGAKMTGTREQKKELEKTVQKFGGKVSLLNAKMTIKHFGWTDEGLPRFPIGKAFRED